MDSGHTVARHRRPSSRGDKLFYWAFGLAQAFFLFWIVFAATFPAPLTTEQDGFTKGMAVWTMAFVWMATNIILGAAYTLKKALKR